MTREEGHTALQAALAAIHTAAETLRPHVRLFERYARECELTDILVGPRGAARDNHHERIEAESVDGPSFDAARQFLQTIEMETRRAQEKAMERADRSNG